MCRIAGNKNENLQQFGTPGLEIQQLVMIAVSIFLTAPYVNTLSEYNLDCDVILEKNYVVFHVLSAPRSVKYAPNQA